MKAVCSASSGVPDDASRPAFRVDEQLSARTEATPLRCRIGGSARLRGAQFAGKAPEVLGVALWHADGHPPQPWLLWGSRRGPLLTHQRAPILFSVYGTGTSPRTAQTGWRRRDCF